MGELCARIYWLGKCFQEEDGEVGLKAAAIVRTGILGFIDYWIADREW